MRNNEYLRYAEAAAILGISLHKNQLVKRINKYPAHFTNVNGETFISSVLVDALKKYHDALQCLQRLKQNMVTSENFDVP